MKSRLLWLVVIIAAIGGFYYTTIRPTLNPAPAMLNRRLSKEFVPPTIPPPPLPEPKFEIPNFQLPAPETFRPPAAVLATSGEETPSRRQEVPIQDGTTIDFSIGAPVVRSQGDDKAALEKALKEMAEATKDVSFPATAPKK